MSFDDQPTAFSQRFCRLCAAMVLVIALVVVVLLVLLLRPAPVPPPDYASLPLITDYDWDQVQGSNWSYSQRTSTNPAAIGMDGSAPVSPGNVFALSFDGTKPDTEPGVVYTPLPKVREVYAEWWQKVSANWTCDPAGCGKLAFVFPPMGGDMYVGIYCNEEPYGACSNLTPGHFIIGGQLQWGAYGGYPILANVTRSPIIRDTWHHLAFYLKWSSTPTAEDGIWRVYVDGILNLERTDLSVSIDPGIEFQFAPTRQMPPPNGLFLWIDHTILRGR